MRLFSIVNYSGLDLRLKIEYDFFKEIMRKKIPYSPEPPKKKEGVFFFSIFSFNFIVM